MGELTFTEVSVAGAPAVSFCVDPSAGDPVAAWFLTHGWIDEPVQRAFLSLLEPGMRVLDLGCHLGTFSLPASALGASVLAVDATRMHVELLTAAAERNGFGQLWAVTRAISDSTEPVAFVERSIHGHVGLPDEGYAAEELVYVDPATVDSLLAERGWDGVDLVKMDIEGMETVGLRGMRNLFASPARPPIVFECNASTLPRSGSSICQLREAIADLGYELLLIDHLRPGTLVEFEPLDVQPECVCDYVALPTGGRRPPRLTSEWAIEPRFSLEQLTTRLLDTAAGHGGGYRAYAAGVLAHGPEWLRECTPATALRTLRSDREHVVRDAIEAGATSSALREHANATEPRAAGRPPDVALWARDLGVRRRLEGLERAPSDGDDGAGQALLEGASLHVRSGQLVGLVSDSDESASALLAVLAGQQPPSSGMLERSAGALLLSKLGAGFEPNLTVSDNISLYAAFLGYDVGDAERRAEHMAGIAGLESELDLPLGELDAGALAGLALSVALELTAPRLLLVDLLPPLAHPPLVDWLLARSWQLRQAGGCIVQVVAEERELWGPAAGVLWLAGGRIALQGHGASVFEARRRALLGLPVHGLELGLV
ncbi:MAG TPA: FkbM family methyltransferase [Solirubrobacteraceae bacterium]